MNNSRPLFLRNAYLKALYSAWKFLSFFRAPLKNEGKRILVINHGFVGDILATTPLLKRLVIYNYEVGFSVIPEMAPLCKDLSKRVKIIPYIQDSEFYRVINEEYDKAVIIHPVSFSMISLLKKAGISERIGFFTQHFYGMGNFLLTKTAPFPLDDKHKVIQHLRFLNFLGEQAENASPQTDPLIFNLSKKELLETKRKFFLQKKYVIVAPGSRKIGLRDEEMHVLSTERWAALCDYIVQRYNLPILIVGSKKERELCETIMQSASNKKNIKNLCGRTSLRELAAITRLSQLVLSVDSGTVHIAASQNAKIIDLINRRFEYVWYPWMNSSRYKLLVSKDESIGSIGQEEIEKAIDAMLIY